MFFSFSSSSLLLFLLLFLLLPFALSSPPGRVSSPVLSSRSLFLHPSSSSSSVARSSIPRLTCPPFPFTPSNPSWRPSNSQPPQYRTPSWAVLAAINFRRLCYSFPISGRISLIYQIYQHFEDHIICLLICCRCVLPPFTRPTSPNPSLPDTAFSGIKPADIGRRTTCSRTLFCFVPVVSLTVVIIPLHP